MIYSEIRLINDSKHMLCQCTLFKSEGENEGSKTLKSPKMKEIQYVIHKTKLFREASQQYRHMVRTIMDSC